MRWRFQYSLRTLLILSLIAGAAMWWWSGRYARRAAELNDPKTRVDALFTLLEAQRYRKPPAHPTTIPTMTTCEVEGVILSPQPSGPPCYLVCINPGSFHSGREASVVVDGQGYLIESPEWGFHHSLINEIVRPANAPIHCVDDVWKSAEFVNVWRLTSERKSVLQLVFNRKGIQNFQWRVVNQEPPEIQIVPLKASHPGSEPIARFIWSEKDQTYSGPDGGVDEVFMRLKLNEDTEKEIEAFNNFVKP